MAVFLRDIVGAPGGVVAVLRLVWPVWRKLRSRAAAQVADTEAIEALGVGLDRYRTIQQPALVVAGTLSPSHLRPRSEALADALPDTELVVLPRGGHGMHLSAPGRIADVIARFADRLDRGDVAH